MKNIRIITATIVCATTFGLVGCASHPSNRQVGTGVGAVAGGLVGNAVFGGPVGTIGGAAAGALIGNVGKLHKPRVEQAGFAVLKAPDIPSVLVETAFISNPDEEAKLRSSAYQNQLADALMRGITRYFAKNPPLARSRTV